MEWTTLNFRTNTVSLQGKEFHFEQYHANQKQHRIFYNEFIRRGKDSCSFKEFRERCKEINQLDEITDFDHRGHNSLKYGYVNLDMYDFLFLKGFMKDKENDTLEQAFYHLKKDYFDLKKQIEENEKNKSKEAELINAVKSLKYFFNNN